MVTFYYGVHNIVYKFKNLNDISKILCIVCDFIESIKIFVYRFIYLHFFSSYNTKKSNGEIGFHFVNEHFIK